MVQLSPQVRRLFDAKNFAVLSTLEPNGMPHSTVVWVMRDEADLLFALPNTRRKVANLIRDPRATVVVFDATDPYQSVQVQGTASITDDPDGTLIDALSHKYTGGPYPGFAGPDPQWSTVRVKADRVTTSWLDSWHGVTPASPDGPDSPSGRGHGGDGGPSQQSHQTHTG